MLFHQQQCEHHDVFVVNNLMNNCYIGIEVKDFSTPYILNNVIINNFMGINSYQKKEIFGGGHAEVYNTLFYGNTSDITFINTFEGDILETDNSDIHIEYSIIPDGYQGNGNIDTEIEKGIRSVYGEGNLDLILEYFPDYMGEAVIGIF